MALFSTGRAPDGAEPSAVAVEAAYRLAVERYAAAGVDVAAVRTTLDTLALSIHCWQGDDVAGFEDRGSALGGGLAVTGAYPGRARTPFELRTDLEVALSLIPGRHRVNLHASYGESAAGGADRDTIGVEAFSGWIEWARERGLGLDFNPTCFGHPLALDGLTLAHPDPAVRRFWIEHCRCCRRIGSEFGRRLGSPCVTNVWVPDGFKDTPADRLAARERLRESLDTVFAEPFPASCLLDAVEPKLFGIGAEACTVGSAEFLLAYCITRRLLLCLDAGHFHPTESVADKIAAVLPFLPGLLLHVSRGVRWDSDHVVVLDDALLMLAREAVACRRAGPIHIGLDYFDASINRVAAWVIGARNTLRALLVALLEPPAIRAAEVAGDTTGRLALQEEARGLPWMAVWEHHCLAAGVPAGAGWLDVVRHHEQRILGERA
jgi:L-rhamnose isomerase